MKINGNIKWDLCGVPNKQKHYCTFVVLLMIHGSSTVVSTQSFKHSLFNNHSSLGNHMFTYDYMITYGSTLGRN